MSNDVNMFCKGALINTSWVKTVLTRSCERQKSKHIKVGNTVFSVMCFSELQFFFLN